MDQLLLNFNIQNKNIIVSYIYIIIKAADQSMSEIR